jgi:hypothetical protein
MVRGFHPNSCSRPPAKAVCSHRHHSWSQYEMQKIQPRHKILASPSVVSLPHLPLVRCPRCLSLRYDKMSHGGHLTHYQGCVSPVPCMLCLQQWQLTPGLRVQSSPLRLPPSRFSIPGSPVEVGAADNLTYSNPHGRGRSRELCGPMSFGNRSLR